MGYSAEVHKKAYEVWKETRSMSAVADVIGCTVATAMRWSRREFDCMFGCQWHGWMEMAQKQFQESTGGALTIASDEPPPPSVPEDAPTKLVPAAPNRRIQTVKATVRSDIQRICDLEFLYCKLFYELTGIPLRFDSMSTVRGESITDIEQLEAMYQQGKRSQTQEGAIRCLNSIIERIAELRKSAGLDRRPSPEEEAIQDDGQLTLEYARKMQRLLENTDPEKLGAIKEMLDSEAAVINANRQAPDAAEEEDPRPLSDG